MLSTEELRKKDLKALNEELVKAREALLAAQLSVRMNQDKKAHLIRSNKRYVAQILTVMNEKERAAKTETTAAA
jgi:ribosomal protein L29